LSTHRSRSRARFLLRFLIHSIIGLVLTLISTFIGERSAHAKYPDIMGCEIGCEVVATGWPFVFVRDYLGMSVGNRADISEVWFAADQFDWPPFLVNVVVWALSSFVGTVLAARSAARRH
jgi:hypothetical protein